MAAWKATFEIYGNAMVPVGFCFIAVLYVCCAYESEYKCSFVLAVDGNVYRSLDIYPAVLSLFTSGKKMYGKKMDMGDK